MVYYLELWLLFFYSCCFVVMSFLLSMLLLYTGGFYIFFAITSTSTYWYHLSLLNYKLHFTIHVAMINHMVGGLEHFLPFHILEIIIPTDWYFQRGRSATNQSWLIQRYHTIGSFWGPPSCASHFVGLLLLSSMGAQLDDHGPFFLWYRWPIEIDGLPFLKMVDLSMANC